MRIHENDLWPKKIEGSAQIPYIYSEDHNLLLNYITLCHVPKVNGWYSVEDTNFNKFKETIRKGRKMNEFTTEVEPVELVQEADASHLHEITDAEFVAGEGEAREEQEVSQD